MDITEVLGTLLSLGPVVTILVAVIIYLHKKLSGSEKSLKELNRTVRDNDKENILLLDSISHALDKLSDKDNTNTDKVLSELRNLRDLILAKLEK
jgi:uncharacterized membrane protein YvbJ